MECLNNLLLQDYRKVSSDVKKEIIWKILQSILVDIPIKIKFSENDIRSLSIEDGKVILYPPNLSTLLSILKNPSYQLGVSFMNGSWFCEFGQIPDLIDILINRKNKKIKDYGLSFGINYLYTHYYKQYINPNSTRKVNSHYNDNPKLYKKIIGSSMVYSCAFFDENHKTLDLAQKNKLNIVFKRLKLNENQKSRVLDVGCGWGSFILHHSNKSNITFDGISISGQQINFAKLKAQKKINSSTEKNKFEVADYLNYRNNQSDVYDGIISIGMLEHVGKNQYADFFGFIKRLLKNNCFAVIHTITRNNDGMANPWFDKFIFPGGYIPRVSEVIAGIEDSGLNIEGVYTYNGENYYKTLKMWTQNLCNNYEDCINIIKDDIFKRNQNKNIDLNFESRKIFRMWLYYLSSIQIFFKGKRFEVTHFVVSKPNLLYAL